MGYCYGRNATGRMALACDRCGNVGGVRKRTCPHKVLTDSSRGPRATLAYCTPSALCGGCFHEIGGSRVLHRDCKDAAAASQAEYDANQARLDAGELTVLAAWGDWHETVPAGMAGVLFGGRDGQRAVLVPAADYQPGTRPWLSDYRDPDPWTAPGTTKRVAV
jgi:hypothetical protein